MVAFTTPLLRVFYQGQVAAGAKVYVYQTGTTTPVTTYSDAALTTPHAHPIVADSNGEVVFFVGATVALKISMYTSADVLIRTIDPVYPAANYTSGGSAAEASIVAAATTDLGSTGSTIVAISGSTTITAFGSSASTASPIYNCRLTGAPLLTHNATSLILPGGANIQGADGDAFIAEYLGSGNWKVLFYQKASGRAAVEPSYLGTIDNLSFAASVASNALTIALKTKSGSDPSTSSPVTVAFRNSTLGTGDYSTVSINAATSLVVSSGSTLGTSDNTPFRAWIVGFNDGGTFRLGIINCFTANGITPLDEALLKSSTAEGGAGAADSAGVFYTGSAVTSKAFRILGYVQYNSGLATAGTWSAAPDVVQLFGPGVKKPGEIVSYTYTDVTGYTAATSVTAIPQDDSIPQNTEGYEWGTHSHTPTHSCNQLQIKATFFGGEATNTADFLVQGIWKDSVADALTANANVGGTGVAGAGPGMIETEHRMQAGTTSAITFKARASLNAGTTLDINGYNGARKFGGVAKSTIEVWERAA